MQSCCLVIDTRYALINSSFVSHLLLLVLCFLLCYHDYVSKCKNRVVCQICIGFSSNPDLPYEILLCMVICWLASSSYCRPPPPPLSTKTKKELIFVAFKTITGSQVEWDAFRYHRSSYSNRKMTPRFLWIFKRTWILGFFVVNLPLKDSF